MIIGDVNVQILFNHEWARKQLVIQVIHITMSGHLHFTSHLLCFTTHVNNYACAKMIKIKIYRKNGDLRLSVLH